MALQVGQVGQDPDRITDVQGNTWVRGPGLLVLIRPDGAVSQTPVRAIGMAPDHGGGCYLVRPDSALAHWDGSRVSACPVPREAPIRQVYATADGQVYLRLPDGLRRWSSAEPDRLHPVVGIPPDSLITGYTQTAGRLYLHTARRLGSVADGRVAFINTLRFPQLAGLSQIQVDPQGRMFLFGTPEQEWITDLWVLDGQALTRLRLPGPC